MCLKYVKIILKMWSHEPRMLRLSKKCWVAILGCWDNPKNLESRTWNVEINQKMLKREPGMLR